MPGLLSVKVVMGILLTAVIIVLVVFPLGKDVFGFIFSVFFPKTVDENSLNNFNALSVAISGLLLGDERGVPYYISNQHILVGFDKECGFDGDRNCPRSNCVGGEDDYYIPKPGKCSLDKACLCLFFDSYGEDFENEDNIGECNSFSSIDSFFGNGDFNTGDKRQGFESLVIYGSGCGDDSWGARSAKVEKIELDSKIAVIISNQ